VSAWKWVGVVWVVALAFACGTRTEGPQTLTQSPAQEAPAQAVLRVWMAGEPQHLDPALTDFAVGAGLARNLFATLLRFDPRTGELAPYVAQEVPSTENGGISADGLVYTFHLRPEAVWEDGRPIRAQDFVYALLRIMDPRVPSYYGHTFYAPLIEGGMDLATAFDADPKTIAALREQVGVKALDDHTLQIRLVRPAPTFNLLMALWPAAALRQDVVEAAGDIGNTAWARPGRLIAGGPFRLAEWTPGQSIVLERNPRFWLLEMAPRLERIQFLLVPDPNAAFTAYRQGDLDMVAVPPPLLPDVEADARLSRELRRVPMATTMAVFFNHRRPPLDRREARLALCRAVDREAIVRELLRGLGHPTTAWLPPSLSPYFSPERGRGLSYDPAAARKAGASVEWRKIRLAFANVGISSLAAQFLQSRWQQHLGLQIELVPLDPSAFGQAFNQGDFDLALVGFQEDYHHPENWLRIWLSDSPFNTSGYRSPDFDAAVAQATEATGQEALARWQKAEETLIDRDVALCPVFNGETAWLVKPYVQDLIITAADAQPGDHFYWQTRIVAR